MMTSNVSKMRTPWGKAQNVTKVTPSGSILEVSTAGHGGLKLDRRTNALVHEAWRQKGGWYEEDCEHAIVALTFGTDAGYSLEAVERARVTAKDYYPDAYEAVYGVKVTADESSTVREREALAATAGKYLILACWGEWATNVPDGRVGVFAKVDGRDGAPDSPEGYFTITKEQREVVAIPGTMVMPLPDDAVRIDGPCPFR
jgi:hypothetical protein